jgi:ATP-dependent DNA helicase RecG
MPAPLTETRDLSQSPRPAKPAAPRAAGELRPSLLNPLFAALNALPGVGPAVAGTCATLLDRPDPRCLELLAHLPARAIDPTPCRELARGDTGQMVTLGAVVEGHRAAAPGGRAPHRVVARAAGETVELAFFGRQGNRLAAQLKVGAEVLLHGQLERYGDRWQIAHPELLDPRGGPGAMVPVYPLVRGLGQRRLRAVVRAALERVPGLPEWLPADLLRERGWPAWAAALHAAHLPPTMADLEPASPARQRLVFEEVVGG